MYGLLYECKFLTIEETNKKKNKTKKHIQVLKKKWDHHGRDRMIVGFTCTYAMSAYHH